MAARKTTKRTAKKKAVAKKDPIVDLKSQIDQLEKKLQAEFDKQSKTSAKAVATAKKAAAKKD